MIWILQNKFEQLELRAPNLYEALKRARELRLFNYSIKPKEEPRYDRRVDQTSP